MKHQALLLKILIPKQYRTTPLAIKLLKQVESIETNISDMTLLLLVGAILQQQDGESGSPGEWGED